MATDSGRSPQAGRATHERSQSPLSPPSVSVPNADETLLDALDAWAFNVMLECSGREDERLEMAIGGAILDLRDLEGILEWARLQAQGIEAQRAETVEQGSVHESPVGNADAPKD